jgi:two-component system chemotaxis sensor kinase CheA
MDEMNEILEDFLVESFELIEQIGQDLIDLENRPDDMELLNSIFRVAHTIKGSSSFLNFDNLTNLTHNMEDVLNRARRNELAMTSKVVDVVFESVDKMKALLEEIRESGDDTNPEVDIESTITRLISITDNDPIEPSLESTPAPEPIRTEEESPAKTHDSIEESHNDTTTTPSTSQIDIEKSDSDVDYSKMSSEDVEDEIQRLLAKRKEESRNRKDALKAQQEKAMQKEIDNPASEHPARKPATVITPSMIETPLPPSPSGLRKPESIQKEIKQKKEESKKITAIEQTIRVEVNRLDHLMNLIGELVLGKNRLIKIYDDVEERYEGEKFLDELNQVVSSVSMVTTDLQIAVMKTRMLPVAKVFNKFPRMVRDLSRDMGKQIELNISGEDTELDKSIIEEIGDPLVHIIRNSCDHGIEGPEMRKNSSKSAIGTIDLKAYNEGNHIVIEISDDGKGLDPEMLKAKSIEKDLITEREAENMSDKEAYSLIFKPGFSTAAAVTSVSGRGVGMDVVKTNIEKLNGIIDIDSKLGRGTKLKLKIPLTLAIIQALLVGTQEEFFAIPLASVLETVRVSNQEIYMIEGKSVLRLRDEVLSLVKLADLYGVEQVYENSEFSYVVVIGVAETKIGVIVDNLVGQEEIVIKSLGDYLQGIPGIAGATIRGDGNVTLIVDISALMELAKDIGPVHASDSMKSLGNHQKNSASDYTVMLVDDSKTDRSIMRKSIESLGVNMIEATNGEEALDLLKKSDINIDCMLVDIEMPRMDGYTLAGEIRKYSRYRNLPLIAVTSRTSKSDRLRGVEVGMTEYITKPYSLEYLAGVVSKNIKLPMEFMS